MNLPFEVGDTVELRSFELGYRGAWFRCKILKIFKKARSLCYDVEYLDYPGEGIHTTKVFQHLDGGSEKYIMIRPVFPRKFRESEVLDVEKEPIVVHDSWKVRDLVDWSSDYCYWSATVLEVRANESLQIELLAPPYGEGCIYEALSKDLRPSLDWSLEDGWTVPFSKDGEKRQCAKLMKHLNKVILDEVSGAESMEVEKQRPSDEVSGAESVKDEEQGLSDEVSGAEPRDVEKQRPTEKVIRDGDLPLNIMESQSIEAAVMDLEELIVRFGWLKSKLATNSSEKGSWVYGDYRPSSTRM